MENIKLRGAKNIRDLGGLPVAGGTIKPKMLLRASHLGSVSDSDIDTLILQYHLRTVIDLRTAAEKKELPDIVLPNYSYYEMPIFDDSLPGLSHESKQDLSAVPDLKELYAYVMNSDCVNHLAEVVRKIVRAEDKDFSILYHCTEGKDRTGMVTAILLLLLGADRQVILEDYLFTNTVNAKKAKKYYFLVKYFKRNREAAKRVYNVFLAREEYIGEVFRFVDAIGVERFTRDVLKLSQAEIDSFRDKVVER